MWALSDTYPTNFNILGSFSSIFNFYTLDILAAWTAKKIEFDAEDDIAPPPTFPLWYFYGNPSALVAQSTTKF